jgi:uncharacterized protein YjbI with pentapeptide repeats
LALRRHSLWLKTGGADGEQLARDGASFFFPYDESASFPKRPTFSQAILPNADFKDNVLSNVDFSGADLTNASFKHATLVGVSFRDADLSEVSFRSTSFVDVDFCGARLWNVHFHDLDLSGCEFDDSLLGQMVFAAETTIWPSGWTWDADRGAVKIEKYVPSQSPRMRM